MPATQPEHVRRNRDYWNGMAEDWVSPGERQWASNTPAWGCWEIPETELRLLPADLQGLDTIELGCGTGYVSGWLARRGARAVGVDASEKQLETARRLAEEYGVALTLHHGNAEDVPWPDASFDLAVSEYGAATWCDPHLWIPEAHRLLRPGGELMFVCHSPFAMTCAPPDGSDVETALQRPYFGMHRLDWTGLEEAGGVEFNLPISGWLALFRRTGFEVADYREIQIPADAPDKFGVPAFWAHRWPAEQAWKLRKREAEE